MKTYLIKIEGPGTEGSLDYVMDESEFQAFKLFTEAWNDNNQNHAAPFITVEEQE